jgi:sugar phosphate isomerase/epimerase
VKTLDGIRATAARFQAAAEAMAPHGITFAFHNHWWEFLKVGDVVPYDMIMELAPAACSELDVYWAAFGGGDPAAELKKKGSRIPLLHVKDGPLTGDPPDPHTAVGHGKLDMPAIISAADPNVLEWLIVELDFCATDMMQAVVDSYTYLTSKGLGSGRR